jgi:hypothetical protein
VEFIMDDYLIFKSAGNLSWEQAATIGVGALVSFVTFRWEVGRCRCEE